MAMPRSLRLLGLASAMALLSALAFVAGVRTGANESALLQSTVNGALLVSELKTLRAGGAEKVIYGKELELDGQIYNIHRLQVDGRPWLFWPESSRYEHERYLRRIAAYRREHPPVLPQSKVTGTDEMSIQMRRTNEVIEATTNQLIDRYAK